MRRFTDRATEPVEVLLNQLLSATESPEVYRDTMYKVGLQIGHDIASSYGDSSTEVYIACTVEDADFLAKGIIDALESKQVFQAVRLACFWNERSKIDGFISIAPILKRYSEPFSSSNQLLVVVKSIISGACVVKTNLTNLIKDQNPSKILITAPVMYKGANLRLEKEFTPEITKLFSYLTYAIDDEKSNDGNITPGIGGDVYQLLGFGDQQTKNRYIPEIVKRRRINFANP
ncbi:hypothetical protein [Nitrosomonas sp.]|uniref:hypothetical protein n=1 Tax=Nitrosomonas sp. TaxID=42353 RepID=UPI0037C59C68